MIKITDYNHIKAIHVLQNDKIIYEDMKGNDEDTLFPVGCIFKTVVSAMVGIAIHEGKINSIHDKIVNYYPKYEFKNIWWNDLCISHALSNTTGLAWPGPGEEIPNNMEEVFKMEILHEPGTEFMYKPDPQIVVYLLEDIYGATIQELFEEKILSHCSSKKYNWPKDNIQGLEMSIGLLDEIGEIFLHNGRKDNEIIFDEQYFKDSIVKYSKGGFPECLPYGLAGWIDSYNDVDYYLASGFGGQMLGVIPERGMVISILSNMDRPHPENREIIHQILEQVKV